MERRDFIKKTLMSTGGTIATSMAFSGCSSNNKDLANTALTCNENITKFKQYEITYLSVNSKSYPKPITSLVMEPNEINSETGAMLFTHGWSGNRFQHRKLMEFAVEEYNVACISVEYRQSGYDFDMNTGYGSYRPYDASFYQVFDVLNGMREFLKLRNSINRNRLFHYGASQGGHIALLSAIFAPDTFGFVYSSSPIVYLEDKLQQWAGREFSQSELSIRNVTEHTSLISTPVFLEHGTDDETISVEHTLRLERKLKLSNKECVVKYYKDGSHNLEPTITRLEALKCMVSEPIRTIQRNTQDNFLKENKVNIVCGNRKLTIDWSKPSSDVNLFSWA